MPDRLPVPPGRRALTRRTLLLGGTAAGVVAVAGVVDRRGAHAPPPRADPFQLGIASGDPLPDRVVLWTRLLRHPLTGDPYADRPVAVEWEMARDRAFSQGRRSGRCTATPELAHSVHADVGGLEPGTDYWYRFRAAGSVSATGRTRTAPAAGERVDRLRLGVVNCQDYQNGYWPAYAALADEELDVVLHLGDYIYEFDPRSAYPDRLHNPPETPGLDQLVTLRDYRTRYELYKSDPALQAAHAAFPWIVTWDDHDVENNYAGLDDQTAGPSALVSGRADFARQRARAYQAWYEHLPVRARPVPGSPDLRVYRRFDFGDLARLHVLDTRQYRTDQPGDVRSDLGPALLGRGNSRGQLLGPRQEAWLGDGLRSSPAGWNVLVQQVMMARGWFGYLPGTSREPLADLDQWDGYAPARTRLLRSLHEGRVRGPVVLSGDTHSSWFNDLKLDFDDPDSPTVASEYVATSVSSAFPARLVAPALAANPVLNPHVRFFDPSHFGYLRVDVDRERWLVEQRSPATIATRTSPVSTVAAFATEAGRPGVAPA